jgi:1,4-dihydroxy-2-naphthoyl-CoA hydrolase
MPSDGDVQQVAAPAGGGAEQPFAGAASRVGWFAQIGLEIVHASASEVRAEWSIDERHLQPHGIVHGGVYASVVESCCSVGAVLAAPAGKQVVGVENHTSFLRAVREGRLRARAVPLHAGRQAQLWECAIVDEGDRLIATGRLRVFCVDAPDGAPPRGQRDAANR